MKSGIHPEYTKIAVKCTCGNSFETRSTIGQESLHVEVCSNCHPFYTGKQKIVDTAGRVEDFNRRFGSSLSSRPIAANSDASKASSADETSDVVVTSKPAAKSASKPAAKPAAKPKAAAPAAKPAKGKNGK